MSRHRTSDIVVSTTGELEGWTVTQYIGVVSAHVVAGTNLFSDVAASFSDVFGGRSSSYKRQLEDINDEVTAELKEKAAQQGADVILGLRIDHDEISGQQKGMLMVTASGTAVRAKSESPTEMEDKDENPGMISARQMEVEGRKQRILQDAQNGKVTFNEETWQFLIENRVEELAASVRSVLVNILPKRSQPGKREKASKRGKDYFLTINEETAKEHLYKMLCIRSGKKTTGKGPVAEWALEVLKEGKMMDFQRVRALLDQDDFLAQKRALEALAQLDKRYYTEEDLRALKDLAERIPSEFEEKGEVMEVEKSGMMSSGTKKVWQIKEGVHNDMDREYCEKTGLNIYGFGREETKPEEAASKIRSKTEALEKLL